MVLVDTNIWIALVLSGHELHSDARRWVSEQRGRESLVFCRATQQSFLRVLTIEAVTRPYGIPPKTNAAAWELYRSLLADRRIGFVSEPDGKMLEARWKEFGATRRPSPKLWMDAYLAACAVVLGCELVTADRAFEQFKGLKVTVLSPGAGGE